MNKDKILKLVFEHIMGLMFKFFGIYGYAMKTIISKFVLKYKFE